MAAKKHLESDSDEPENYHFKVVLMGDSGTGKTSIIMRFTEDFFDNNYKQTVGVDFFQKRIDMPKNAQVNL